MAATLKLLIAVIIAACSTAAFADPPARVGRLSLVSGAVSLAPAEAPDHWVLAPVNRPLTSGDRLWTDADARAVVHVGPSALRLAGDTALDVLYLDDDMFQLRLAQGVINLRVRELVPEEVIEIATPAGAILITQPGSYRVSVDPATDSTRAAVRFGAAEVVTPYSRFVVPSSQAALLAAGEAPLFEIVTSGEVDEFDRWAAELDRREDRPAATRYVSPHMTGYQDLDEHGAWSTHAEYGSLWYPRAVSPGWAPYRYGHWAWISPWGWTWIDDAPWGFAPFHYGRWVLVGSRWAWAPGPIVPRPVYAPGLVAFVGGAGWSVTFTSGPAVGWFPLGWREPFLPWYRTSTRYVQRVNITHVTHVTAIRESHIRYVHRERPEAVTVVPRQAFVGARHAGESRFTRVDRGELARAPILRDRPAEPTRASFAPERAGGRPPARASSREVLAIHRPSEPREGEARERGPSSGRGEAVRAPVRIIEGQHVERRSTRQAPWSAAPQPSAPQAAPAPDAVMVSPPTGARRSGDAPADRLQSGVRSSPDARTREQAETFQRREPRNWRAPSAPPGAGAALPSGPAGTAAEGAARSASPSSAVRPESGRERPPREPDQRFAPREVGRTPPAREPQGVRALPQGATDPSPRLQRFQPVDPGIARSERSAPPSGVREAARPAERSIGERPGGRRPEAAPSFGGRAPEARSGAQRGEPRGASRSEGGGGRGFRGADRP
jgi:hypothetical protein